jgi:hypothetical protein
MFKFPTRSKSSIVWQVGLAPRWTKRTRTSCIAAGTLTSVGRSLKVLGKQFPDIKRAVVGKGPKTKKNPEGSDVYESEQKYLDRVLAGGHSLVELQPLAEQTAAQIPFDPSAAERSTKVGKEYLELADGVIAKGNDAVEKATAKLLGLNATFGDVERYAAGDEIPTGAAEGQVTRESLAALIRANTLRKAQEDLV